MMREPDLDRLMDCCSEGYDREYIDSFRKVVAQVVEDRFTKKGRATFTLLSRLSKYKQFQKRDGGIVTEAMVDGRLSQGREL
jgi:hypothetical protein